jgi:transcriptional regulator with XRE-family HTH domain
MKTFSKRLAWLLAHEEMSRAEFAHKVRISVSSLSHLLSDRNLPGMELLMAMCREFPGLNPSWLLLGQGEAFGPVERSITGLFDSQDLSAAALNLGIAEIPDPIQEPKPGPTTQEGLKVPLEAEAGPPKATTEFPSVLNSDLESDIEYVMVFYRNGTFKKYKPAKD